MYPQTLIERGVRQRLANLEELGTTKIGWPEYPKYPYLWDWINLPSGYYGYYGKIRPDFVNCFGKKRQIHLNDCESAAKLFSKQLVTIASDCKNPKVTKIQWGPSDALTETIILQTQRDAWTFAVACWRSMGYGSTTALKHTLVFLRDTPFSIFDHYPDLRIDIHTSFDPTRQNVDNLTGNEILGRISIRK